MFNKRLLKTPKKSRHHVGFLTSVI